MEIYNKYKDHPAFAMYELYHWEAHPSSYDDSHNFIHPDPNGNFENEWWREQPFTRPNGLEHRLIHYECYKKEYPDVTIPSLVDDGSDGSPPMSTNCLVSKKFRAKYTSVVTVGLDGKVAYVSHWPPGSGGTAQGAVIWVGYTYDDLDEYLEDALSSIDGVPPEVAVTSPSGGEELEVGDDQDIEWTATDNVGVVSRAIYLTTDGSTYELVDSTNDNTGTFAWTVPDESSNNCKIKVYAYDEMGNTGNGESNVFSIGGTGIINNLTKAKELMTIRKNPGSYSVYNPFSGSYDVTITDVQGKQLASFTTNGRGWYTIPVSISSGMHFVSIRTPEKTIVSKIWFIR